MHTIPDDTVARQKMLLELQGRDPDVETSNEDSED